MVRSVCKREADWSKCTKFLQIVLILRPPRICGGDLCQYQSGNGVDLELISYLLEKKTNLFRRARLAFGHQMPSMYYRGCHWRRPCCLWHFLFSYFLQFLLDVKAKFIPPVNCTSFIEWNGNYQFLLLLLNLILSGEFLVRKHWSKYLFELLMSFGRIFIGPCDIHIGRIERALVISL